MAFDATGNLWATNIEGDTLSELLAGCSNASCTGLNFDPAGANFDAPAYVAMDAAGNAWVANEDGDSVTELNSSGALAGNFAPARRRLRRSGRLGNRRVRQCLDGEHR